MQENLEIAKEALAIQNVCLRSSNIKIYDKYEPFEIDLILKEFGTTSIQSFNTVSQTTFVDFDNKESDPKVGYIFNYVAGIRLLDERKGVDSNDENLAVCLLIEANFSVIYSSKEELSNQVLDAFKENNVGYHIWPYWREYVQSSCARLSIETLSVPFYQLKT